MFGFISRQAYSVSAKRRPDMAVDTLTDARRSGPGARQALGEALIGLGQRVAGEMPASRPTQPDGDCA